MKKIVYTIVTDLKLYEKIKCIKKFTSGWDYNILLSENKKLLTNWGIIHINKKIKCKLLLSRYYKINIIKLNNFINKNDITLYIDSKFTINYNLDLFWEKFYNDKNLDLVFMKHKKHNCLYKEAEFCINHNIGDKEKILKQIEKYKKEKMPENFGLFSPGIMLRKHNDRTNKLMKTWWNEIKNTENYRDQISLPYAIWKNKNVKFKLLDFNNTYKMHI